MEIEVPIVAPAESSTPGNMPTVTPDMLLSIQVGGQGSLLQTGLA